jgi:hypothetical protein
MPFEKTFENSYEELSQNTLYRFAELEISLAIPQLMNLYRNYNSPRQSAIATIFRSIIPNNMKYTELEEEFSSLLNSPYFNKPPKDQLIHYLLFKGHSYNKIRNLTSASFNTISKLKFGLPVYYPSFQRWNPEILHNWNEIKSTLNLFNEELAHIKI